MIEKGPLQLVQSTGLCKAFDGDHAPATDLTQRHHARADLLIVDEHRARAAVARLASDLGAGQSELIA